jgi:hypothetical protein
MTTLWFPVSQEHDMALTFHKPMTPEEWDYLQATLALFKPCLVAEHAGDATHIRDTTKIAGDVREVRE